MLKRFKQVYLRQLGTPGFLGLFVNPFYFSRRSLLKEVSGIAAQLHGRMVDVGCGQQPYRHLFDVEEYCGVELDTEFNRKNKKAEFFYDGKTLPFQAGHFDALLCNQVLEHVPDDEAFVAELARVVKPGGLLVLTAPFIWDEHEQPYDFKRYTSYGIHALMERHGLSVIEFRKTCADASLAFQVINAYTYKTLLPRNPYLHLLLTVLLIAPVNVLGAVMARLLPANPDMYLDNIVLVRKQISSLAVPSP